MQSQDPRSWAELSHEIHVTQHPRGRSRSQRKRSTWTDSASISRPTNGGPGRNKYIEHQAPRSRYHRFPYIFFWYRDGDWDTILRCRSPSSMIKSCISRLDFEISSFVISVFPITWLSWTHHVTHPRGSSHVTSARVPRGPTAQALADRQTVVQAETNI